MLLFIAGRRLLIPSNFRNLVTIRFSHAGRCLLTGFGLAVVSIACLLAVMSLADVYTPYFRLSLAASLSRFASAVTSSVFAGILEEFFFAASCFSVSINPAGRCALT
jgi:hypothetical protein